MNDIDNLYFYNLNCDFGRETCKLCVPGADIKIWVWFPLKSTVELKLKTVHGHMINLLSMEASVFVLFSETSY